MIAGLGVGLYSNLDDAYKLVKKPGTCYQPNAALTGRYENLYRTYREIYPSLKSVSRALFNRFKG